MDIQLVVNLCLCILLMEVSMLWATWRSGEEREHSLLVIVVTGIILWNLLDLHLPVVLLQWIGATMR